MEPSLYHSRNLKPETNTKASITIPFPYRQEDWNNYKNREFSVALSYYNDYIPRSDKSHV